MAKCLQLEIGGEAALGHHLADARRLEDADLEPLQRRVVEALEVETAVVAIGEHVGRAIDGNGGQRRLVHHGQVEQHVAHVGVERLARQAALEVGAPEIDEPGAERLGEDLGDLILIAAAVDVGERQVAGVGTHAELIERLLLEHLLGGVFGGGLFRAGQLVERLLHVARRGRRHGGAGEEGCTQQQGNDAAHYYTLLLHVRPAHRHGAQGGDVRAYETTPGAVQHRAPWRMRTSQS